MKEFQPTRIFRRNRLLFLTFGYLNLFSPDASGSYLGFRISPLRVLGGYFLTLYILIGKNCPCRRTLKMQNKAKLKSPQIPVTASTQRTNKNAIQTPQPKNKPKQTQNTSPRTPIRDKFKMKAERRKSSDYFHNGVCHSRSSRESSIKNYPAQHWAGFLNFALCILIFDMLLIEPNFRRKTPPTQQKFLMQYKPTTAPTNATTPFSLAPREPIRTQKVERSEIPNLLRETHIKPNGTPASLPAL